MALHSKTLEYSNNNYHLEKNFQYTNAAIISNSIIIINISIILLYMVETFKRIKILRPFDSSALVAPSLFRDLSNVSLCIPRSEIMASPISSLSTAICVDLKVKVYECSL